MFSSNHCAQLVFWHISSLSLHVNPAQGSGGSNFNGWWVLVVVNAGLAAWAGATPHLVGSGLNVVGRTWLLQATPF